MVVRRKIPKAARGGKTAAKRRTQAERSAETRARLIDAAIRCICERGYANATTVEIARRAMVSRGALQHQFRTRNDLFLAVTDHVGHEIETAFPSPPSSGTSVEERVDAVCRAYWKVFRSDAYVAQIQIWLGARHDPGLRRPVEKLMRRFLAGQDRMWQETFADIEIPPARLAALRHIAIATIRGLVLRTIYRPDTTAWSRELALLREMAVSVLRGL